MPPIFVKITSQFSLNLKWLKINISNSGYSLNFSIKYLKKSLLAYLSSASKNKIRSPLELLNPIFLDCASPAFSLLWMIFNFSLGIEELSFSDFYSCKGEQSSTKIISQFE